MPLHPAVLCGGVCVHPVLPPWLCEKTIHVAHVTWDTPRVSPLLCSIPPRGQRSVCRAGFKVAAGVGFPELVSLDALYSL